MLPPRKFLPHIWAAVALFALGFALTNAWLAFGFATWALLGLGLAIGFGPDAKRPAIAGGILAVVLIFSVCLWGMAATFHPEGPLSLVGGIPEPTAYLVYGIWPAGLLPGLLYALVFERSVLPEDRLREFRRRIGQDETGGGR